MSLYRFFQFRINSTAFIYPHQSYICVFSLAECPVLSDTNRIAHWFYFIFYPTLSQNNNITMITANNLNYIWFLLSLKIWSTYVTWPNYLLEITLAYFSFYKHF